MGKNITAKRYRLSGSDKLHEGIHDGTSFYFINTESDIEETICLSLFFGNAVIRKAKKKFYITEVMIDDKLFDIDKLFKAKAMKFIDSFKKGDE